MARYYSEKLSAERLRLCYEIAPPRVRQYLEAEIDFVLGKIGPADTVLETGCGYGRVLIRLAARARCAAGIDTSLSSLSLAQTMIGTGKGGRTFLAAMDAASLGFADKVFDRVVCIQNGLSAFKADQRRLVEEAVRVTRPGGTVLFSSYAERFWDHRLDWFHLQAKRGLIGEIDEKSTGNGVIACKDGFRAVTLGPGDFLSLTSGLGAAQRIIEVDRSSLFCELTLQGSGASTTN